MSEPLRLAATACTDVQLTITMKGSFPDGETFVETLAVRHAGAPLFLRSTEAVITDDGPKALHMLSLITALGEDANGKVLTLTHECTGPNGEPGCLRVDELAAT